jgi:hypothetical protein
LIGFSWCNELPKRLLRQVIYSPSIRRVRSGGATPHVKLLAVRDAGVQATAWRQFDVGPPFALSKRSTRSPETPIS